jgi:hypothetical protein
MLNAFVRKSSFLIKSISLGLQFIMGIPSCSLNVGLWSQSVTSLRRRSDAYPPSWSWVGWVGMIKYPDEHENVFESNISRIQWDLNDNPSHDTIATLFSNKIDLTAERDTLLAT